MKKCITVICMFAVMNLLSMEEDLVLQLHNALTQVTVQSQTIRALLFNRANPNAPDRRGNTSLHKAKKPEHIGVLLECGAQINAQNAIQYTPLMHHIYLRNHQAAECFIAAGADLSIQDNSGYTALHHAVRVVNESSDNRADCKIVQSLLQRGAHFDLVDAIGEKLFNAYTDSKLKKIAVPYIQAVLCSALGSQDHNKVIYLAQYYSWIPCMIGEQSIMEWVKENCFQSSVEVFEKYFHCQN